MAKGSESKSIFYAKILETFEGSFMYNDGKEIRIPFKEDGKDIQLTDLYDKDGIKFTASFVE